MRISRPIFSILALCTNCFSAATILDPWRREVTLSPLARSLVAKSTSPGSILRSNHHVVPGGASKAHVLADGSDLSEACRQQLQREDKYASRYSTNNTSVFYQPKSVAGRLTGGATASNGTMTVSLDGGNETEVTVFHHEASTKIVTKELPGNGSSNEGTSSLFRLDPNSAKKYSRKLKNRNYLNMSRKLTHASAGVILATLNTVIPRKFFVPGMTVLTTGTLVMEMLRYRRGFGWMNDALHFVLGSSLRKHEMEGKFTGAFYYFLGVTVTAYCYPGAAASLGIMQLAVADPSASYFGRQTKHIYWSRIDRGFMGLGRNKGILGFLGGALFCVPFNLRMLSAAKWGPEGIPGGNARLALASLALGLAGSFADLAVPTPAVHVPEKLWGVTLPPFHVDDNFVVPLFSAFACARIFSACDWNQNLALSKLLFF